MRRASRSGMPVVVKVGSSSLTGPDGAVSDAAIVRVVDQVESLWASGRPTVLVTSAAVAAGLPAMGLTETTQRSPRAPGGGRRRSGIC